MAGEQQTKTVLRTGRVNMVIRKLSYKSIKFCLIFFVSIFQIRKSVVLSNKYSIVQDEVINILLLIIKIQL